MPSRSSGPQEVMKERAVVLVTIGVVLILGLFGVKSETAALIVFVVFLAVVVLAEIGSVIDEGKNRRRRR